MGLLTTAVAALIVSNLIVGWMAALYYYGAVNAYASDLRRLVRKYEIDRSELAATYHRPAVRRIYRDYPTTDPQNDE